MTKIPKISLERILAERYGDKPDNPRREYQQAYMRKWRADRAEKDQRASA